MYLSETLWGYRHDLVSQDASIVTWWYSANISFALDESIIEGTVSCINQMVTIISQGESTIEIKNNISINIFEEISLRLLKIDKAHSLNNITY